MVSEGMKQTMEAVTRRLEGTEAAGAAEYKLHHLAMVDMVIVNGKPSSGFFFEAGECGVVGWWYGLVWCGMCDG